MSESVDPQLDGNDPGRVDPARVDPARVDPALVDRERAGPARVDPEQPIRDQANPWRRLTRRVAYENAWITVLHDDVTRPDGQPGVYGVVHFANLAIGVVALDEAGRVLLVGQYRYPLDRYSWEIPEGGAAPDETPLDGARRELVEETGYAATTWRELLRADLSNSVTDEQAIIYLATGLTAGAPTPEGTEEIATRWATLDEALHLVARGEIRDIMTISALQAVALERVGPDQAG